MESLPQDIYTEPSDIDVDTLGNLGPLSAMAGIWEGTRGLDVHPKAEGPKKQAYIEHYELQPIRKRTGPSSSTACATTRASSSRGRSRRSTTRWATGFGSPPTAP